MINGKDQLCLLRNNCFKLTELLISVISFLLSQEEKSIIRRWIRPSLKNKSRYYYNVKQFLKNYSHHLRNASNHFPQKFFVSEKLSNLFRNSKII